MSRKPDMSDPASWDEDDIRYLKARNRLPAGFDEDLGMVDEDTDESINFAAMTVDDLKVWLSERDLLVGGNKNDLIERAQAYIAEPVE